MSCPEKPFADLKTFASIVATDTWDGLLIQAKFCAPDDLPALAWVRAILTHGKSMLVLDSRGTDSPTPGAHPTGLEIVDAAQWLIRLGQFTRLPDVLTQGDWQIQIEWCDENNRKKTYLVGKIQILPSAASGLT